MDAHELSETFLRFFEERGHRRMPSAPIVPAGDPTLLFTSAGMVQFKPYFMGQAKAPHKRLASVQKCFRTSDIESVGDTSHLTFFEMLGNFAIADYFKAQIIPWAWELATEVLGLQKDRLWTAVYLDDDEAYNEWLKVGVAPERIVRYGEEENYWFSGEVGPCGPCSEIYYDFGEQFGCEECEPSHECGRFLEIWNLVFMSFYCDGDSRTPLPASNIDTGSGLERVSAALLYESPGWDLGRLPSCYDTDLFAPLIKKIEALSGKRYGADHATDRAIRILAEHARAVTFLIGDERTPVPPSNEERGYVVRRMLRRALYFARRKLGIGQAIMPALADTVVDYMSAWYPELERQRGFINDILGPEERRFDETLSRGLEMITEGIIPFRRRLRMASARFVASIQELIGGLRRKLETMEDVYENGSIIKRATRELDDWERALDDEITSPRTRTTSYELAEWAVDDLRVGRFHELKEYLTGWTADVPFALSQSASGLDVDGNRLSSRQRMSFGLRQELQSKAPEAIGQLGAQVDEFSAGVARLLSAIERECEQISGREAFTLHDTYGFPIELTREIAAENGFTVDEAGFEAEMERQRDRGRAHAGAADHVAAETLYASLTPEATAFLGYEALDSPARVVAVVSPEPELSAVDAVETGSVELILDRTPFYPEGGGQVGDRGEIRGPNGVMRVEDTQRVAELIIVHRGRILEGRIAKGDEVTATVDAERRADTMRNHTATHLLHAALRKVLGTHARQAGSLVGPDYLRFDFTHTEAVTPEQLAEVSRLVNEKVREDIPVSTRVTTFDEAMSEGVLAFFGDKYGAEVRVVEVNSVVPRFSAELCGGTHCHATGQVGAVIITGESSIGSGMRRIEALTGRAADEHIREQANALAEIARKLGAPRGALMAKIDSLVAEQETLRKRVEKLERSLASAPATGKLMDGATSVDGVSVLATEVDAPSMDALRYVSDNLRKELTSGVAVLAAKVDGRPQFVAIVSKDLMERGLHAGKLLKRVATAAGGGGGGRADMAQGGGKDVSKISEALGIVPDAVREMLGGIPPLRSR